MLYICVVVAARSLKLDLWNLNGFTNVLAVDCSSVAQVIIDEEEASQNQVFIRNDILLQKQTNTKTKTTKTHMLVY